MKRPNLLPKLPTLREFAWLAVSWAAVGTVTAVYVGWLGITNHTIVALSFLLVVLIVAAVTTLWVAIATSVLAFLCFNFFFFSPVGTFTIDHPEDWVSLFTLLVVSIVASELSARARRRAQEAMAYAIEREHFLKERQEAEVVRRSNELKSALLASLSHDLRTPLTAVTVAANNLNASWLSDEQRREQTVIVLAELERLNRLFQKLVDMARIEIDAVAAEREWVQPPEIVEAAVQQVEHALREHHLEVHMTAERTLVRLDPRLTSAALAHLLENAAHYSPSGSRITVDLVVLADEVRIAVRDRGIGIAQQDLERLFDRFYRGASAAQHTFGTGMGLAITRGLLAAQGGRVWADNVPEAGATFTIAVPVETQSAVDLEEQPV